MLAGNALPASVLDKHDAGRSATVLRYGAIGLFVGSGDALLIVASGILSGLVHQRYATGTLADPASFLNIAMLMAVFFIAGMRTKNQYRTFHVMDLWAEARAATATWSLIFACFAVILFALKTGAEISRGWMIGFFLSGLALLLLSRVVWRRVVRGWIAKGRVTGRRVVLVGASSDMEEAQRLDLRPFGFDPVARFELSEEATRSGDLRDLVDLARENDVKEVIIVTRSLFQSGVPAVLDALRALPLPVRVLPDAAEGQYFLAPCDTLGTRVAVEVQRAPLSVAEQVTKALMDKVLAGAVLAAILPFLGLVALAVKLDSPGPALFRQTRRGFNGKPFKIMKFRTMRVMEDGDTVRQASRNDDRITRVGRFLRRTSLDELPQLFNVLGGEMSLVGPRPHAVAHDNYYETVIAEYAFRHHVKPGITGWAQVNGLRGETPTVDLMAKRIALDVWYVNNWSATLDLRIIVGTVLTTLNQRNAY